MSNSCPYPYNDMYWNVNDQYYWCDMVNDYGFPVTDVPEPFKYVIENGKCDTFETEYNECKSA